MPPVFYSMMAVNNDFVLDHDVYIPEAGTEPYDESTRVAEVLLAENENSALNLFPNPATNAVVLEWKADFKQANILVYDATGRLVWQHNWLHSNSLNINTSAWESGIYWIKVQTQSGEIHNRELLISK